MVAKGNSDEKVNAEKRSKSERNEQFGQQWNGNNGTNNHGELLKTAICIRIICFFSARLIIEKWDVLM